MGFCVASAVLAQLVFGLIASLRRKLDQLADEKGLEKMEQWYSFSLKDLRNMGIGTIIHRYYHNSVVKAMSCIYPEMTWYSLFDNKSSLWPELQKRRTFFDQIAADYKVVRQEDWYNVTWDNLKDSNNASFVSNQLGGNLFRNLQRTYPEFLWIPWKMQKTVIRFFERVPNQRMFCDWYAAEFGIHTFEEWHGVTTEMLLDSGFSGVNTNVAHILENVYPEFMWQLWTFAKTPERWFTEVQYHKMFFDWISDHLGLNHVWHGVRTTDIPKKGILLLIRCYERSLPKALETLYPENRDTPWMLISMPRGYWQRALNQRKFFDWFADTFGIDNQQGWYNLKQSQIAMYGSIGLLQNYDGSFINAVYEVYPEYNWMPWLFQKVPARYWDDKRNALSFLEWVADKLGIHDLDDWYRVSSALFSKVGGSALLIQHASSIFEVLKWCYPHHPWDRKSFDFVKKAQVHLVKVLSNLATVELDIRTDYKHPQLFHQNSKKAVELDVFIPSLSLAFEYHGAQHYGNIGIYDGDGEVSVRDEEKKALCKSAGITLIEIPYWWDYQIDTLAATIHKYRPDLLPDPGTAQPIPETPPKEAMPG